MKGFSMTRRDFVRLSAGAVAAGGVAKNIAVLEGKDLGVPATAAASDTVRFGVIGTGTEGCDLLRASRRVAGSECVAAADLYDTRQETARELVNANLFTTRDYRRILDRKDIDAVIVATP